MTNRIYTHGAYLAENPTWHIEDSLWKAQHIITMLGRSNVVPKTVCEVGCGAGEILSRIQQHLGAECELWGYEVSPQAFHLCEPRANQRLHFVLGDILQQQERSFDLLLAIDLIEHVEDYLGFLRNLRPRGHYKIFHIPLDLSVQTILRSRPILKVRQVVGHLHYFTKETAMQSLRDTGYEILDYFYTSPSLDLLHRSALMKMAALPRRVLFALHRDLTVRIMGGYSLMILAR